MQTLGWRHITLPDNTVYFVHSGMQVTTDIDLRVAKKLEDVTKYLQYNHLAEGIVPPAGWEMWLVDSGTAPSPKTDFTPFKSWVNHPEKILSFEYPPKLNVDGEPQADDSKYSAGLFEFIS